MAINAHSLKPQAEFMGIPQLKETLVEIEQKVKAGQYTDLEVLFKKAYALHKQSEIFLKNYLEKSHLS